MIIKDYKTILRGVWDLSETLYVFFFLNYLKVRLQKFLWAHLLFIARKNIYCSVTETKLLIEKINPKNKKKKEIPILSSLSIATVSKALLIIGYSSRTSLKLSTEREYRRQYVSARTLAVRRPLVRRQISGERKIQDTGNKEVSEPCETIKGRRWLSAGKQ